MKKSRHLGLIGLILFFEILPIAFIFLGSLSIELKVTLCSSFVTVGILTFVVQSTANDNISYLKDKVTDLEKQVEELQFRK